MKEFKGPSHVRPFRSPDITITSDFLPQSEKTMFIWILDIQNDMNANMLYAYDNQYFNPDKVASLKLVNNCLSFRLTPEGQEYHAFGEDDEEKVILKELKAYIDREFEKEVLL